METAGLHADGIAEVAKLVHAGLHALAMAIVSCPTQAATKRAAAAGAVSTAAAALRYHPECPAIQLTGLLCLVAMLQSASDNGKVALRAAAEARGCRELASAAAARSPGPGLAEVETRNFAALLLSELDQAGGGTGSGERQQAPRRGATGGASGA